MTCYDECFYPVGQPCEEPVISDAGPCLSKLEHNQVNLEESPCYSARAIDKAAMR